MALDNFNSDQKKSLSAPLTIKKELDITDGDVEVKVDNHPEVEAIPEPQGVYEDALGDLKEETTVSEKDGADKLLDEAIDEEDEVDSNEEVDDADKIKNLKAAIDSPLVVSLNTMEEALAEADKALNDLEKELSGMSKEERRKFKESTDSKANRAIDNYRWSTGHSHDLHDSMKLAKGLVRDGDSIKMNRAKFSANLKSNEDNVVTGAQGRALLAAISGSVERVVLPNSGIHISLRTIPLDVLNSFYTATARTTYEYGRRFGEFYYTYSRLEIVRSFVDIVLPVAIFGSNYVNYRDKDALYNAISYHDLNTLVWAMSAMMYPQGVKIAYHCSKCTDDTIDTVDVYKLKVEDSNLITPEVIEWLHKTDSVNDEKLAEYRTKLNLDSKITRTIGTGSSKVEWTINLTQATLKGYLDSGKEFLIDLTSNSNATEQEEVNQYMFYNKYKQYKPWIKSISCVIDPDGEKKRVTILNDGDSDNSRTISETLDSLRNSWEDMDKEIDNYILSTRLMHTAFYMPKCPRCGAETDNVNGFIPFDALSYFFTLTILKLNTDRYRKELRTISKGTTTS